VAEVHVTPFSSVSYSDCGASTTLHDRPSQCSMRLAVGKTGTWGVPNTRPDAVRMDPTVQQSVADMQAMLVRESPFGEPLVGGATVGAGTIRQPAPS
jgi:hypothetical protein